MGDRGTISGTRSNKVARLGLGVQHSVQQRTQRPAQDVYRNQQVKLSQQGSWPAASLQLATT